MKKINSSSAEQKKERSCGRETGSVLGLYSYLRLIDHFEKGSRASQFEFAYLARMNSKSHSFWLEFINNTQHFNIIMHLHQEITQPS